MFCSQCGTEAPDEIAFCPNCGAQVEQPRGAMADSELESQAARGDREAFAELYVRHFDRVYDFLLRMVRDADEAADLAQETFLRAMRALSPKEKKAAFSTWLFTIARNLALKRLERQRRIAAEPEQQGDEEEPIVYRQVDTARFADPQEAVQAQEISGLVWQAAAGLSAKEYSLLDLHVRQGLESAEIAHVLGVSKGNAYTMMSRLKDTFESAVAALQLLQQGRRECDELSRLLEERRITFISPEARRLIDRHVAQCLTCQEQRRRLVSPTAIFGSLAAVPVPLGLKPRIAEALMGSWAEAGSEAVGGLKGLTSQAATRVATLPTAWKAAILAGLLIVAVGGGLGGWVGVGGGVPLFGNGGESSAVPPAAHMPSPTPSRTPVPTPSPTATPTPLPATGGILFASHRDGQSSLYLMRPDGTDIQRLADLGFAPRATNGELLIGRLVLSPDRTHVAFSANAGEVDEVYIANIDGSNRTRVARAPVVISIEWSPDGERLAFNSIGNDTIYVVNADGSGLLPTSIPDEVGSVGPLRWSPDSSRIAFTGVHLATPFFETQESDMWVMNADGSAIANLTNDPNVADAAGITGHQIFTSRYDWSPDGTQLSFCSLGPIVPGATGPRESGIYTIKVPIDVSKVDGDRPEIVRITSVGPVSASSGCDVLWSPRGDKVIVNRGCTSEPAECEIYAVNPDGSGELRLGTIPTYVTCGARCVVWNLIPEWSPDGEMLAATGYPGGEPVGLSDQLTVEPSEIYLFDPDRSGSSNITNHPAQDVFLAWLTGEAYQRLLEIVEATPTPSPTGGSMGECPVSDEGFCEFAAAVARAVREGDADFILSLTKAGTWECGQLTDADFAPACESVPPGTSVECFIVGKFYSEGVCLSETAYRDRIANIVGDRAAVYAVAHPTLLGYLFHSEFGPAILLATPDVTDLVLLAKVEGGVWQLGAMIGGFMVQGCSLLPAAPQSVVPWPESLGGDPSVFERLGQGCGGIVFNVAPERLNIRSEPTMGSPIVGKLAEKEEVCLVGGLAQADGFWWWRLHTPDGGEGWAAAFDPNVPDKPWLLIGGSVC